MNSIASGNQPHSPKWQNAFWGVLLALISMAMLYAGGLGSLQTMTLIAALPFGIIMLMLCIGLLKDRKSTRLNSSHANISYAVFCLKKKNNTHNSFPSY